MISNTESKQQAEIDSIVESLPTRSEIFLPTEKIGADKALSGLRAVKRIYEETFEQTYQPQLRALRERYKDQERCFVIGNGPSLNQTNLAALKNEVTFAVNGFFLKMADLDWTPTFYVVEDHLVAEDRQDAINALKGPHKLFPIYLAYCLDDGPNTTFFKHLPRKSYPDGFDFSTDAAENTYAGCTVTFTCLQLAYYMGFKEIYLIGVDADYEIPTDVNLGSRYSVGILDMESDDPNHFHPDYFGKGYRWHDPQVDKMLDAYEEARTVVSDSNQQILNATMGGELEVFPRINFDSLFSPFHRPRLKASPLSPSDSPRCLLVDFTRTGDGTATGELKKNIFSNWPASNLLQFFSGGEDQVDFSFMGKQRVVESFNDARQLVEDFRPDVILYRPVPNNSKLHQLAMKFVERWPTIPLVTWIVDDWPMALERARDPKSPELLSDLKILLKRSHRCFSISQSMSDAFEQRYRVSFEPIANGIDPNDWETKVWTPPEGREILVRYAGSLAEDMTLDSIVRVAETIEKLAMTQPIRFEIKTNQYFRNLAQHKFENLDHTQIISSTLPDHEYRKWIQGADLLLIAYNFDNRSKTYIQYSLANKMPECLASGVPTLAHGPSNVATVEFLKYYDCALVVSEIDTSAIEHAILQLLSDPATVKATISNALAISRTTLNIHEIRDRFLSALNSTADIGHSSQRFIKKPFRRNDHARIDESELIAKLIATDSPGQMIDVGAHHGMSSTYFVENGWNSFCFEPDAVNREQLQRRFSESPNVHIDERAVSDVTSNAVPFFRSPESTGISGLMAFRDSHKQVDVVHTTTITDVIEEFNLGEIDYLKIDVEGHDLSVLRGVPWSTNRPRIVQCEFEDSKTSRLGHTWKDIADYLVENGYTVYVSEWYPIKRYGIAHDWRGIKHYPCELEDTTSWGNLIGFLNPPDDQLLTSALSKVIRLDERSSAIHEGQHQTRRTKNLLDSLRRLIQPIKPETSPHRRSDNSDSTTRVVPQKSLFQSLNELIKPVIEHAELPQPSRPTTRPIDHPEHPASESDGSRPTLLETLDGLIQSPDHIDTNSTSPNADNNLSTTEETPPLNETLETFAADHNAAIADSRSTIDVHLVEEHQFRNKKTPRTIRRLADIARHALNMSIRRKSFAAFACVVVALELTALFLTTTGSYIWWLFTVGLVLTLSCIFTLLTLSYLETALNRFKRQLQRRIDTSVQRAETRLVLQLNELVAPQRVSLEKASARVESLEKSQTNLAAQLAQSVTETYLEERTTAIERQLGEIRYPDAPQRLVFFGHHKCASRFFRFEVFSRVAELIGADFKGYEVKSPPFHYSQMDELDLQNIDLSNLAEDEREVVVFANTTQRSLELVQQTTEDWLGLRVIRDPRHILISNYFHHKTDHHTHYRGWVWDKLILDRPKLRELGEEEGILYELNNISGEVLTDQIGANLDDHRIMTVKLEAYAANTQQCLKQIATFLKVPSIAGLNLRNTSSSDVESWQNHFTPKITSLFKERYGDLLVRLGYEKDLNW